jgi:septum formation protein
MLAQKFKNTHIILGSQSPRRQELLKGLDIDFTIETRPVNEVYDEQLVAGEITAYLARLKATAFAGDLAANQLLITSDTIVWQRGNALEKPTSSAHAKSMLSQLSGASHEVYTSVCFTSTTKQQCITDCTTVYIKPLTTAEINYYIANYKPMDKAGAYGVQDWLGYVAVEKLVGCYYNVMGLPLPKVYDVLKEF